jgi:hypothetical protein
MGCRRDRLGRERPDRTALGPPARFLATTGQIILFRVPIVARRSAVAIAACIDLVVDRLAEPGGLRQQG